MTTWKPTPERFAKYLAREVELAKENMRRGVGTSLHSAQVVAMARVTRNREVFRRLERV